LLCAALSDHDVRADAQREGEDDKFDNNDQEGSLTGTGPSAQRMADRMSEAFLAFAHTGNPNNRMLPKWEPYRLPLRRTMVLDDDSRLVDDPRGAERRLFAKVPFVQQGT